MIKIRHVRTELKALGFEPKAGKGSHEIWTDPQAPQHRLVLSGSDGSDALKYQLARVRKFRRGMMVYED